ncbi:hypothetical protein HMJ29_03140 [Hymenobacter taeanensis]|uniref:Uncharacterized protein n=1 Tax=Hymenobacter taeanensis TaxID=2735321 RepID=A0A6M6BFH0_9BACT|nr:hypothetical protein [Hymenobacter taeanensis]QJX45983.1 hypothetical protein HMJ29_03140 [Hymenobacter taeanensis]
MSLRILVVAAPLWLGIGNPVRQAKPAPDVLRRPGETTVFSFVTGRGKTVSLCEGPKSAYLVYRFGTASKTELQYPAVLDASSWSKFTYFRYFRGGGVANAGREEYRLSFRNGNVEYQLYDLTHAEAGKDGNEEYPREIGIDVSAAKGTITGKESTSRGGLGLSEEQRERVTIDEGSF